MTDIDKLLALAREQLGTAEQPPGSNNVIYNTDYYGGPVSGPQYPWCCAFVWWLFQKAGLSALFCGGEKTAYCPYVVNWAKQHGQWVTGGCRPGDLLLYDWDGDGAADHIGVCERLIGQAAIAIEGNCGDAVQEATRSFVVIMGAYRPEYGEDTSSAADAAPSPQGEGLMDIYTVRQGDTLWGIAEQFLGHGWDYPRLLSANPGLTANIHPGQTIRIPGATVEDNTVTFTATVRKSTYAALAAKARTKNCTIGEVIDKENY